MQRNKLGYIFDIKDKRDFTTLPYLKLTKSYPATVDLTPGFSPIEDQGNLGSCTANAAIGALEYLENQAYGKYLNASRLFLYKVTRNLMGLTGDSGASMRDTAKAIRLFGVCPEKVKPYKTTSGWDTEPTAFMYAYALSYQPIDFYKVTGIDDIKQTLASKLPIIFGFDVYWDNVPDDGILTMPDLDNDEPAGGHAVVACGYDEKYLFFRNSWGKSWGINGYGRMPWDYVILGIARDFWVLNRLDLSTNLL